MDLQARTTARLEYGAGDAECGLVHVEHEGGVIVTQQQAAVRQLHSQGGNAILKHIT